MANSNPTIVFQVRNQESGSTVQTIDNRNGSFREDGSPWYAYCATHDQASGFTSRAAAAEAMAHPTRFCGQCKQTAKPRSRKNHIDEGIRLARQDRGIDEVIAELAAA